MVKNLVQIFREVSSHKDTPSALTHSVLHIFLVLRIKRPRGQWTLMVCQSLTGLFETALKCLKCSYPYESSEF